MAQSLNSGSTAYGNFHNFCRDSTLPICNLFSESYARGGSGYGGCELVGISLSEGRHLRNLGAIIIAFFACVITLLLLALSQRKRAAVGRREMQLFLIGYFVIEVCSILAIGGFPLRGTVRIAFSAIEVAMITATTWMLMINGAIGFQLIDDGTPLSLALIFASTGAIFIGTGYIALDTAYDWSGYWNVPIVQMDPNRSYSLYTLCILCPMVFLFIYFVLESILVLKVLGEKKPMFWLILAFLFFIIGMIFDFVISVHICNGVNGKIDGSLFTELFVLMSVITIWHFWSSITEDDWVTDQIDSGQNGY